MGTLPIGVADRSHPRKRVESESMCLLAAAWHVAAILFPARLQGRATDAGPGRTSPKQVRCSRANITPRVIPCVPRTR